jgi:hypothetical protein
MNTDIIKENLQIIEKCKHRIKTIKSNENDFDIELRVFTKGGWNNIDFNPKHKPLRNYVVCQLIMDLENQIKEAEKIIKKAVNE